jgi:hypothetical protein
MERSGLVWVDAREIELEGGDLLVCQGRDNEFLLMGSAII